jgi:hypothetical protein
MSGCPFERGYHYMHYSLMGKMRLPVTDSDLLYRDIEVLFKAGLVVSIIEIYSL